MNAIFLEFENLFVIFSIVLLFSIVFSLGYLLAKFVNSLDNLPTSSREFPIDNYGGDNYEKIS